jgi:integrase
MPLSDVWSSVWSANAAEVDGFPLYDLRHTCGTHILHAAGNLAAAKKGLRHKGTSVRPRFDDDGRNALGGSGP